MKYRAVLKPETDHKPVQAFFSDVDSAITWGRFELKKKYPVVINETVFKNLPK